MAVSDVLVSLMRCALNGGTLSNEEKKDAEECSADELYKLAKHHDVANIAGSVLYENGITPAGDAEISFRTVQTVNFYRVELMEHTHKCICDTFESAEIDFIPLKGAVLREFYPDFHMRTSCDIDILVKPEQLEAAVAALKRKLGFSEFKRTLYDVELQSPEDIVLELHFVLTEKGKVAADILKKVWNHANKCENSHRYRFDDGFFIFYTVSHIAKHFMNGGSGIRTFMDLWVARHKMGIATESAEELLKQAGLLKFYEKSMALSEMWFSDGKRDAVLIKMADYVLSSGTYGTLKNHVDVYNIKKGGRIRYALFRAFMPYRDLKNRYSVLKKHPALYPYFTVKRWFDVAFGSGRKTMKAEMRFNSGSDSVDSIKQLMTELDIVDLI